MKRFFMRRCFLLLSVLLLSSVIYAQTIDVKGVVKEKGYNEPLIGVSVVVKETNNGTATDMDGKFHLKADPGATIIVSYVGFRKQEFKATQDELTIYMEPANDLLDEVVIVGYGVQKKSVVTAAIASVKGDDLGKVMPTRVDNILKGMVSGVNITQASGQPGDGSKVLIRGTGTITNSSPLYIVDGMSVGGGIDFLNPADIESVEVLKDAASAAIYGSRGANGVILVSTRKGKEGKATINYNFSYGWQNPWRKRAVLDGVEYATLINEMLVNDGLAPRYEDPKSYGKGTDWQDQVFNYDAPVSDHQISVSGATDKMSYYLSLGSFNQEGIVGGNFDRSNYDRKTIRLNTDYLLFDETKNRSFLNKLKVGVNMAYSRTKNQGIGTNGEFGTPLGSALALSPLLSVYVHDEDEKAAILGQYPNAVKDRNGHLYTIAGPAYNEITNPVAQLALPGERHNADKFVGSFWGELDLFKGLKFRSAYNIDLAFWGTDGHRIPFYFGETNSNAESAAWSSMNRGFTGLIENTLSYTKQIKEHGFTILLGQSAQSGRTKNIGGSVQKLNDNSRPHLDGGSPDPKDRAVYGQTSPFHRLASYFGRLSYDYNEKYMVEFTVRRDGSSNFGKNNLWGTFPSVSAGWNVTNEKFMENRPDFFTYLKLRGSWGRNGNESIESFRYMSVMKYGSDYIFGPEGSMTVAPGAKPNGYPNQDIKWEESEQFDIGFDTYLFNGAISFSFDWYKKKTIGMLMTIPLPEYIGDSRPIGNAGKMENSGIELDFTYKVKVADVNLSFGANATYLKNKVIDLGNETGWLNYDAIHSVGTITRAENGLPFPYFYGHRTDGIFQNWEEVKAHVNADGKLLQADAQPGDVRFVDLDGNGSIGDEDRTKIGKGTPDWAFGLTANAEWKGLDLSLQFTSTVGNDIFDASRRNDIQFMNMPNHMLGRWIGEGTSNSLPRLSREDPNNNWRSSDLYIKNGSFLRLRNLQVGYTVPRRWTSKASISNLRVYFNAENLWTITSYKGFDPEISSGGTSLGVDRGVYPQPRVISIGANITF